MSQSSLNAAAKAFALENLGESEEIVKDSVTKIQEFLKDNPNINARSDQRSILYFLRSSKFNLDQTEKKLRRSVT